MVASVRGSKRLNQLKENTTKLLQDLNEASVSNNPTELEQALRSIENFLTDTNFKKNDNLKTQLLVAHQFGKHQSFDYLIEESKNTFENSTIESIDDIIKIQSQLNLIDQFLIQNEKYCASGANFIHQLHEVYELGIKKECDAITLVSQKVMIEIDDCSNTKSGDRSPQSHKNCGIFFNNVAQLVVTEITSKTDIRERTLAFERNIAKLQYFFNEGNYLGACAVLCGLSNPDVDHLNHTKEGLSENAKKILADFEQLLGQNSKEIFENNNKAITPTLSYYKQRFDKANEKIETMQREKDNVKENITTMQKDQSDILKKITDKDVTEAEAVLEKKISQLKNRKSELEKNLQDAIKHRDEFEVQFLMLQEKLLELHAENPLNLDSVRDLHRAFIIPLKSAIQVPNLEAKNKEIAPYLILKSHPDIILSDSALTINQKVDESIQSKKFDESIIKFNSEINGCFTDLKQKARKNNSIKERVEKILDRLSDVAQHVGQNVPRGALNDLDEILQRVELLLKDNKKTTRARFLKLLQLDDFIGSKLLEIKDFLQQENNLIKQRQKFDIDNNQSETPAGQRSQTHKITVQDSQRQIETTWALYQDFERKNPIKPSRDAGRPSPSPLKRHQSEKEKEIKKTRDRESVRDLVRTFSVNPHINHNPGGAPKNKQPTGERASQSPQVSRIKGM